MLTPHRNRAFFSNHYLEKLLPQENEWKVEVEHVFKKVKELWDSERSGLPSLNESQLRRHFLDKVFDILGFTTDVEPPVVGEGWAKKPDYAFFKNNDTFKSAKTLSPDNYFEKALCIGEAKRWGRPLDRKLSTEVDPFEGQNPSLQMSRYLWLTVVKWGILTDGKFWRLYEREDSKRLDTYYEIDLEDLILNGTLEDFKYFYLFFRVDAFPAFLDKVYKGSVDYAKEVGDELKGNVYNTLKFVSEGFLKTDTNNLSPENLKEIHDNSLILLYRLLFILYAEYRKLLPLGENVLYTESYSLDALKKEIAEKLDSNVTIPASTFQYWNKLKELFEIINHGNKELCVPPYNGGLFNPEKHLFLEKYRLGDIYIAKAINLLSRTSDRAFIDYGSLEIRHLGSIYEGLLEYKLEIAEMDIYPIKEKNREIYIPLSEAQKKGRKILQDEIIRTGELFLVTDKGERKATGSYYTPDYIVKYIVENTVGPVVEDKKKKVAEKITKIKEKVKTSRGYNREAYKKALAKAENGLIEEILSLKILDPAMGSGHFLVEAVDFLAHELNRVMSGEPLEKAEISEVKEEVIDYNQKESDEEDVRWARRAVVEKCIFGVDVNPLAVELTKLSLWLHTVAKNRPLNFLDHHLRCGNSLIGTKIDDLANFPELKKKKVEVSHRQLGLCERIFKEKVSILLGAFSQIERLPSDTVAQIIEKEKLYQDIRQTVSRFQDVADIWTSAYFGCVIDFDRLQQNLKENDKVWEGLRQETWFKKAKDIANEKRFFHWDIEFPEVFFEGHRRKENPGFDCVIGNPPWGSLIDSNEKEYLKYNYSCIVVRMVDSYMYFIKQALELSKISGVIGQIIPNPFLTQADIKKLRKHLIDNTQINYLLNLGDGVFDTELANPSCVFISQKVKHNRITADHKVIVADLRELKPQEKEKVVLTNSFNICKAAQIFYQTTHNYSLITKGFETTNLFKKIEESSCTLKEFLSMKIQRGISADYLEAFVVTEKNIQEKNFEREICKPVITGHNVFRFGIEYFKENIFYLTRDDNIEKYPNVKKYLESFKEKITCKEVKNGKHPWFALHRPRDTSIFKRPKLVGLTTSDRLVIGLDNDELFAMDNLYLIHLKYKDIRTYLAILSILNSSLLSYLYQFLAQEEDRILPQVKAENLYTLPICHISFVTPKEEREKLLKEAKDHYRNYIKAGKSDNYLNFIVTRLMKKHQTDRELVRRHNTDPLNKDWQIPEGTLWEQSDIVHDILAFLAEQMIEMNKEKNKEARGFLKWLEREIGTNIENLKNKTALKGFHNYNFDKFLNALKVNQKNITIGLSERETHERLEKHFDKSMSILTPLKARIKATDNLIDEIVYRLYGLTEEEIKIVEGKI